MESVSEITDPRPRSCWVEVNLDALRHNFKLVQKQLTKKQRILPIVKAEAYGHGASVVTRTLSNNGTDFFGVATLEEALKLREFGIEDRILIMGHTTTFNAEIMVEYELTPLIYSFRMLKALEEEARNKHTTANFHLKIDTGMGRLGRLPDTVHTYLEEIKKCNHVQLEGVATHFAVAGEDPDYTDRQYNKFLSVKDMILSAGLNPRFWHTNNSAAVFSEHVNAPETNLVRPGITLYGYPPHDKVECGELKPVMSVRCKLADYKKLPAGHGISYGRMFIPKKPTYIGVIPLGYADGYPRSYSNRSYVLKGGEKKPVRGRICMDMTIVELDDDDDPEETVTLLGKDEDKELWADTLAEWGDTITYEVLSRFSQRLPRVYLEDDEAVAIKTERNIHEL